MPDDMELAPDTQPPVEAVQVAVTLDAQHASVLKRIVAAFERGEQWIVDNFHAALNAVEGADKQGEDA
jgi:hypothetical protein